MRTIIGILLSRIILLQSVGISGNDLIQIDEFIEHAQFHSQEHGDNFLVFISKHYGELKAAHDKEHQEEKEEHERLPFQHDSQITNVTGVAIFNNPGIDAISLPAAITTDNFYYRGSHSSLHLTGILQPPRHS